MPCHSHSAASSLCLKVHLTANSTSLVWCPGAVLLLLVQWARHDMAITQQKREMQVSCWQQERRCTSEAVNQLAMESVHALWSEKGT